MILAKIPKPNFAVLSNEIRALYLLSRTSSYIIQGYLPSSADFVWCYNFGKFLYHAFGGKLFGHIAGMYEVLLMLRLMTIDQEIDKDARPLFTDKGLPLKEITQYLRENSERKIGKLINLTKSAMLQTRIKGHVDFEKIQQVEKFFVSEWGYIWMTFVALSLAFKDVHQLSQKELLQVYRSAYNYGQLMKLVDDLVDLEDSAENESWNSLFLHTAHHLYKHGITNYKEKLLPSEVLKLCHIPKVRGALENHVSTVILKTLNDIRSLDQVIVDEESWEICKNLLFIPIHAQLSHLYVKNQ